MPRSLSFDLRQRVLSAVASGLSHRAAGERFGVSAASVSRWRALERDQGSAKPKPLGGDRLSRRTEAHAALIHAALAGLPDISLPELKAGLASQGAHVSIAALWRFFKRHKITRKKRLHTRPSRTARIF